MIKIKNCENCKKKQICHGDYNNFKEQLYYCNTYSGYVTKSTIMSNNCKIKINCGLNTEKVGNKL